MTHTKQIKVNTWSKLQFKIHHHKHIGSSEQVLVLQGPPHILHESSVPDKTLRFSSPWTGSFTQPPPAHLILRRRFMKSLLLQPSARFPQRHLWSVASYSRPIESTRHMIIQLLWFNYRGIYINYRGSHAPLLSHSLDFFSAFWSFSTILRSCPPGFGLFVLQLASFFVLPLRLVHSVVNTEDKSVNKEEFKLRTQQKL